MNIIYRESWEDYNNKSIKYKLANLNIYFPNGPKFLFEFAQYLSQNVEETFWPKEFILFAKFSIEDLKSWINGFTGEKITGEISNYWENQYDLLHFSILEITEAIFGEEFSQEIESLKNKIKKLTDKKINKDNI